MLADLQQTIEENDIQITITDAAKQELVQLGYDPRFGARPLRRVIQDKIEDQMTDLILEGETVKAVNIDVEENEIIVKNVEYKMRKPLTGENQSSLCLGCSVPPTIV